VADGVWVGPSVAVGVAVVREGPSESFVAVSVGTDVPAGVAVGVAVAALDVPPPAAGATRRTTPTARRAPTSSSERGVVTVEGTTGDSKCFRAGPHGSCIFGRTAPHESPGGST
jgi:hypothetical protein